MKPFWTPKQAKALPLLASGMTGAATALAVGCKASTVSDWLHNNEAFVNELERLREQATQQAMGQLQGTFAMAVTEIQRILTSSPADAVRLKAAMFIIDGVAPTKTRLQRGGDPDTLVELGQLHQVFAQLGLSHAST
jgi:hypothetical protein